MKELMVFGDKIGFDYHKEMIETMLIPGQREELAKNLYEKMRTVGFN